MKSLSSKQILILILFIGLPLLNLLFQGGMKRLRAHPSAGGGL